MIKGKLEMAMDFAKRKDVPHEVFSVNTMGKWRVVKRGPKYCNIYTVTECDAEGERWLETNKRDGV